MFNKDIVKVGLIGCGRIASVAHLPALRNMKGAKLAALADMDEGRLMKASSRFGVANVHRDYRGILEDKEIDAVVVVTPTDLHAGMAIDALDAGKHLYIEKPLATSLDDARRVVDKWNSGRLKAMIGFNFRFNSLYQSLKQLIHEGAIGKILLVRSAFAFRLSSDIDSSSWKLNRDKGGGVLFDQASHHIDIFRYLFECEFEEVLAKVRSVKSGDDCANVFFQTNMGFSINSFFSSCSVDDEHIEIYGEEGKLKVDRLHSTSVEVDLDVRKNIKRSKRIRYLLRSLKSWRLIRDDILTRGREDSYRLALEHFIKCVKEDENPKPDFLDGIKSLSVVIAANQSASSGKVVKIAPGVL